MKSYVTPRVAIDDRRGRRSKIRDLRGIVAKTKTQVWGLIRNKSDLETKIHFSSIDECVLKCVLSNV